MMDYFRFFFPFLRFLRSLFSIMLSGGKWQMCSLAFDSAILRISVYSELCTEQKRYEREEK